MPAQIASARELMWQPTVLVRICGKYRHRVTGRELHLLCADFRGNRVVLGELGRSAFCGWEWHGRSQDLNREWELIGAAI